MFFFDCVVVCKDTNTILSSLLLLKGFNSLINDSYQVTSFWNLHSKFVMKSMLNIIHEISIECNACVLLLERYKVATKDF